MDDELSNLKKTASSGEWSKKEIVFNMVSNVGHWTNLIKEISTQSKCSAGAEY